MRTKALLLFVIACGVSGGRLPTALWQFGEMIRCAQPGVNPLAYNEYGCWCGLGGSGVPVDDVDRCCEAHDKCYQNSRKIPGCEGVFDLPYIIIYSFSCSDRQVYCSAANDKCKAAVCECDRVAAHCFARYTYNPDNKHLDPQLCVSRVAAQSTTCLTQPTSKTDAFLVSERKIKVF